MSVKQNGLEASDLNKYAAMALAGSRSRHSLHVPHSVFEHLLIGPRRQVFKGV